MQVAMAVVPGLLEQVFTRRVIRACANNVGIWPYSRMTLLDLAAIHNNKPSASSLDPMSLSHKVMSEMLSTYASTLPEPITVPVRPHQIYTYDDLMDADAAKRKRHEAERASKKEE
jgi:hypothetical protein